MIGVAMATAILRDRFPGGISHVANDRAQAPIRAASELGLGPVDADDRGRGLPDLELNVRVGEQRDVTRALLPRLAVDERRDLAAEVRHLGFRQRLMPLVKE